MSQIYGFHYITNASKDLCTNFHEIKFNIIMHVLREQESITSTILIGEVQSVMTKILLIKTFKI